MAEYAEVSQPILNSPFEKPSRYWYIQEGEQPELRDGRRPPVVFPPRDQKEEWTETPLLRRSKEYPAGYEMALVSLIRERLESWSGQGFPGVTRTTLELLRYWTREGREKRLFYAQLEAALTIIFLTEAPRTFCKASASRGMSRAMTARPRGIRAAFACAQGGYLNGHTCPPIDHGTAFRRSRGGKDAHAGTDRGFERRTDDRTTDGDCEPAPLGDRSCSLVSGVLGAAPLPWPATHLARE